MNKIYTPALEMDTANSELEVQKEVQKILPT